MTRFTASIRRDGDWYVAQCLEIDVASQGETVEKALDALREALELYLEDEPAAARSLGPTLIATVDVDARS